MAEKFEIAFEEIVLHEPFGAPGEPPEPVYLWIGAAIYDRPLPANPRDPNVQPIWVDAIGGRPPNEANDPTAATYQGRGSGLYADVLRHGTAPVRCDDSSGRPKFTLFPVQLEPDHTLVLTIWFGRRIWFNHGPVPIDPADRLALSGFSAALIAGMSGEVATALLVALFGAATSSVGDVAIPCYNPIIAARHQWSGEELYTFPARKVLDFGPGGPSASHGCPRAWSTYKLSVTRLLEFPDPPPLPPASPCNIEPVLVRSTEQKFAGDWGDVGNKERDRIGLQIKQVTFGRQEAYDIFSLFEKTGEGTTIQADYSNVQPAPRIVSPPFLHNHYPGTLLINRTVEPISRECSYFTNLDYSLSLEVVEGPFLYQGGHPGAAPIIPLPRRAADDAAKSAIPERDLTPPPALYPRKGGVVAITLGGVRPAEHDRYLVALKASALRLSDDITLLLYGEYKGSKLLRYRVRYLRTTNRGAQVVADVMLRPTRSPPA